jgi:hypothetical protein
MLIVGCLARKDPMPQTLPFISTARRRRNDGARRPQDSNATPASTPIDAARSQQLADLEREVHTVREAIFHLADTALTCASPEYTQLHVSLQIVSNELGQIERMLEHTRAAVRDTAATAS